MWRHRRWTWEYLDIEDPIQLWTPSGKENAEFMDQLDGPESIGRQTHFWLDSKLKLYNIVAHDGNAYTLIRHWEDGMVTLQVRPRLLKIITAIAEAADDSIDIKSGLSGEVLCTYTTAVVWEESWDYFTKEVERRLGLAGIQFMLVPETVFQNGHAALQSWKHSGPGRKTVRSHLTTAVGAGAVEDDPQLHQATRRLSTMDPTEAQHAAVPTTSSSYTWSSGPSSSSDMTRHSPS